MNTTIIPSVTNFQSLNEQATQERRTVSFTVSADFEMNQPSATLILRGAIALNKGVVPFKSGRGEQFISVILKINEVMLDNQEELLRIPVKVDEVHVIREFLEGYLAQQEGFRAQFTGIGGNPFDIDNYILARLLLVDVREWLLGRITFVD